MTLDKGKSKQHRVRINEGEIKKKEISRKVQNMKKSLKNRGGSSECMEDRMAKLKGNKEEVERSRKKEERSSNKEQECPKAKGK